LRHEEGEKLVLQTGLWKFELITEMPSPPSPALLVLPQLLDVDANTRRHAFASLPFQSSHEANSNFPSASSSR
jgi:hypothetical protein